MPLLNRGMDFLAARLAPDLVLLIAQLLWAVAAFFIPVMFSIGDMKYAARRWREVGRLSPLLSREDFEFFYIPALIRMGVMVLSMGFSLLLLDRIGLKP